MNQKIEQLQISLRSYSYVADYLVGEIKDLELKQQKTRKSLKKIITDKQRQLKQTEINIACLSAEIDLLIKGK